MLRLLFISLLVLFNLTKLTKASYSEWDCERYQGLIYLCKNIVTTNDIEADVEYIGGVKNGKPDGKGEFRIVRENGILIDEDNYKSIKATGDIETYSDNSIRLINGIIEFGDGLKMFRKNNVLYKVVSSDGITEEGTFNSSTGFLTKGKKTFSNNDFFEGSFHENGVPNYGQYYFRDEKNTFIGSFNEDGTYKNGTIKFSNNEKFVGEFNKDFSYKFGSYYYSNGDKYSGSFRNGQRVNGSYYHSNSKDSFEGNFYENGAYKKGTFIYSTGNKYVGDFDLNSNKTFGTMYYASGSQYFGSFKNELPNGTGTFTEKNGIKYPGSWKEGKLEVLDIAKALRDYKSNNPYSENNKNNPFNEINSPFGALNPKNPFSEYNSPSGILNPKNPLSEVTSPIGALNRKNPLSEYNSPTGVLNPKNPLNKYNFD